MLRSRRSPPVIFVSLGTNDDPHAVDDFRASVRATMRVAGPKRCVVWANIVRPAVGGTSYDDYNDVLTRENRHRKNLRVFNWARMARRNRHWFASDGVHVTATGYKARARGIAKQIKAC